MIDNARAAKASCVTAYQVGGRRFVDEDVLSGVVKRKRLAALALDGRDVRATLVVGAYVSLDDQSQAIDFQPACSAPKSPVGRPAPPRSRRMTATNRSSWPASARDRDFVCCRGAIDPVSRRRCTNRWPHDRLTANVAATSSASDIAAVQLVAIAEVYEPVRTCMEGRPIRVGRLTNRRPSPRDSPGRCENRAPPRCARAARARRPSPGRRFCRG